MDEKTSDVTRSRSLMTEKKKLAPLNDVSVAQPQLSTPADSSVGTDVSADSAPEPEQQLDPAVVQLERDEALKKLIDSKKYRVRINESSTLTRRLIPLIVLVCGVGMIIYLLIDSEIVGS